MLRRFNIFLFSTVMIAALLSYGMPHGDSSAFNFSWYSQYREAVSWADPYPRYLPNLWAGFGGHDFFFYAPLPFWFTAVLVAPLCAGCPASTEFVLGGGLLLVASCFTMFAFLRCFFQTRPAMLGALIYAVLPYHLTINWFERQAIGEFAAYTFLPLVALGAEYIRRDTRRGWVFTLGIAGIALSHLPTTLIAGHVLTVLFIVFAVQTPGGRVDRIRLFAQFIWFGGLGLAIASFYWLPAIVLLESVSPRALYDPFFEAWRWLYGPVPELFAFRVLLSFLTCVPLMLASLHRARGQLLSWIVVPFAFALLMNTSISEPIWREWIIARIQFPWRLMIFADFATGVAAAAIAAYAIDFKGKCVFAGAMAITLVPYAYLGLAPLYSQPQFPPEERYHDWIGAVEYLSPEMTEAMRNRLAQGEITHRSLTALVPVIEPMVTEFEETQAPAEILHRQAREIAIVPPEEAELLSLTVQYWSFWEARVVGGGALETRANPDFGTLDVLAPEEGFQGRQVIVSLPHHWSELAGVAMSILALLMLAGTSMRARLRRI